MKRCKRLLAGLLALCMIAGVSITAFADDAVNEARNGVLEVQLCYITDDGIEIPLQGGTAFLINSETLITNDHVITLQSDTREELRTMPDLAYIADAAVNDPHLHIRVVAQRDMKVEARCHSSAYSEEVDFAVIQLTDAKIYDRTPLELADSDAVEPSEKVYALGMPGTSINIRESHTSEDVTVTDGIASKLTSMDSIEVIEHTAKISEGSSGGPLVNENGEVVAVNSYRNEEYYYSIQINHIKKALDTFGIEYIKAGQQPEEQTEPAQEQTEPAPATEPAETVPAATEPAEVIPDPELSETLRQTIEEGKAALADTSVSYTEDSKNALQAAIADGEAMAKKTDASAADLQNSIDAIEQALRGLQVEETSNMIMIIIAAAAVVVVLIIVIIVVVSSRKKKRNKNVPQGMNFGSGGGMPGPIPGQPPIAPVSYPTMPTNEGSGETTVLNQGSGETTVLNGGGTGSYLIRQKNGEKIMINAPMFMIGKEKRRVNYCISDNSSISRTHAQIMQRGLDYYIVDQNSTNYTFVNGVKSNPNQETLLTEGAEIKLSDEVFTFHVS